MKKTLALLAFLSFATSTAFAVFALDPSSGEIYPVIGSSTATGDVEAVGDCASGDCLDGTSDGGTYISLYDGIKLSASAASTAKLEGTNSGDSYVEWDLTGTNPVMNWSGSAPGSITYDGNDADFTFDRAVNFRSDGVQIGRSDTAEIAFSGLGGTAESLLMDLGTADTALFTTTTGLSVLDFASMQLRPKTLQLGKDGLGGVLTIYSEQGATDYTTTFQPGTQTQDITYTTPLDDGDSGQFLSTNGAGVLDWISLTLADADYGDVTISGGSWAVEDDSHSHTTATISDSYVRIAGDEMTGDLGFADDRYIYGGAAADFQMTWETTGNDHFEIDVKANADAAQSGYLVVTPTSSAYTLALTDDDAHVMIVAGDGTNYVDHYHDRTNGRIDVSSGVLAINTDATVPDEVYGAGWNASLEVPTKNAVYDKIEAISAGSEVNNLESITTGIASTEIPIGTGADTVAYAALSGDATMTNAGVVTVVDDLHAHTTTSLSGIDIGDDTNLTAGRSLTLTGDDVAADAELYTDTKCIWFADPTSADDFKSIWFAKQAATITSIWAESDQTVTFMLQVDDGSPADVDSVDLAPAAGTAEDTSLNGDATMAAGDRLDLDLVSVASTPTWCSICWTLTYDD